MELLRDIAGNFELPIGISVGALVLWFLLRSRAARRLKRINLSPTGIEVEFQNNPIPVAPLELPPLAESRPRELKRLAHASPRRAIDACWSGVMGHVRTTPGVAESAEYRSLAALKQQLTETPDYCLEPSQAVAFIELAGEVQILGSGA